MTARLVIGIIVVIFAVLALLTASRAWQRAFLLPDEKKPRGILIGIGFVAWCIGLLLLIIASPLFGPAP